MGLDLYSAGCQGQAAQAARSLTHNGVDLQICKFVVCHDDLSNALTSCPAIPYTDCVACSQSTYLYNRRTAARFMKGLLQVQVKTIEACMNGRSLCLMDQGAVGGLVDVAFRASKWYFQVTLAYNLRLQPATPWP